LGIVAAQAADVAHGLGHGLIGAAVAAWPAVALVGSYELLMISICGVQTLALSHNGASVTDPPEERALLTGNGRSSAAPVI
jgi:hypothetical protein